MQVRAWARAAGCLHNEMSPISIYSKSPSLVSRCVVSCPCSAELYLSSVALCPQLKPASVSTSVAATHCLPRAQAIGEHLRQRPELLPSILTTLFEIVLFEDCSNQWSLSRPMLSLILINEQIYAALRAQVWGRLAELLTVLLAREESDSVLSHVSCCALGHYCVSVAGWERDSSGGLRCCL
jgi:hypothetical protein